MVDYPTDLGLNENKDIDTNDGNDIMTVSDINNLEQSIAISASDAVEEFIGGKITGVNIALLEQRLENNLDDNPKVGTVENVSVEEYDRRNKTITAEVEVKQNENFEMEVSA